MRSRTPCDRVLATRVPGLLTDRGTRSLSRIGKRVARASGRVESRPRSGRGVEPVAPVHWAIDEARVMAAVQARSGASPPAPVRSEPGATSGRERRGRGRRKGRRVRCTEGMRMHRRSRNAYRMRMHRRSRNAYRMRMHRRSRNAYRMRMHRRSRNAYRTRMHSAGLGMRRRKRWRGRGDGAGDRATSRWWGLRHDREALDPPVSARSGRKGYGG
jgi:hypothetical protein